MKIITQKPTAAPPRRRFYGALVALSLFAAGGAMSGCAPLIVAGAGTAGVAVAQERKVGQALDDKVMQTEISAELLRQSETLFRNVSVTVLEGRVMLTGMTPDKDGAARAEKIAWSVSGVKEVLNDIEVSQNNTLGTFAKDTWITTRLVATLVADVDVLDLNYKVETSNGAVYIIGIAQSKEEMDRVIAHARNIDGVTKVVSHIILKNDPRRPQ